MHWRLEGLPYILVVALIIMLSMDLMNNTLIRLSVIIPVYKVENYIEKCARSLFEQTMKEGLEFIFIDDCSPDKSM